MEHFGTLLAMQACVAMATVGLCVLMLTLYAACHARRKRTVVRAQTFLHAEDQGDKAAERLERFGRQVLAFIGRYDLSEREAGVLVEIVCGHSIESAGRRLGLSRDAAKFACLKLYAKAGVSGKQELIRAIEGLDVGRGDADR